MLPGRSWAGYGSVLREIGERRRGEPDPKTLAFLLELRMVDTTSRLSPLGRAYFDAAFVRLDEGASRAVLARAVLSYGPAAAIVQNLHGVGTATRATAETVLRSQGFGDGMTDRNLGSLLMLLHYCEVIAYSKSSGRIAVLVHPGRGPEVPPAVFLSPLTPFSNKAWLVRVLEECDGYIWWFDKHFLPVALEALSDAAEGNRISDIRILSLLLADHDGRRTRTRYRDLRTELRHRGITLEWRTVDSKVVKDTHDRWILGRATARNVPNVNAIFSGQHAELTASTHGDSLRALFTRCWDAGTPIHLDTTETPMLA